MAVSYMHKLAYNNDYNRKTYKSITLRFNRSTEADIIEYLAGKDLTRYIRALITADMAKYEGPEDPAFIPSEVTPPHLVDDRPEHADLERYPYEVMEQLPFYDKYVVAYCEDLEQCKAVITDYCLKNTQVGEMYICKRFRDTDGNIYGRRIRREFIYK